MASAANTGSPFSPRLRVHMNLMALDSLPGNSTGPHGSFERKLEGVKAAGFHGVQFATLASERELSCCRSLDLSASASGRINSPEEAPEFAAKVADGGYDCATLHVGWGLEDDAEAGRLLESVLAASGRLRVLLYIETHRATIFQDMWRTVSFLRRYPEIRINGDFSHWYTGQEMVYGGFEKKLAFIQPVLDRVRFIHGRIGNPGCMQVRVDPDDAEQPIYVGHFKQLWTRAFSSFVRAAEPGESICFAPELLSPDIFYARTFNGAEESDRWQQSLLLKRIAEECFTHAQASTLG